MKIWHISDTHTFHGQLTIPKDIDMVIFTGDCSNPRELIPNEHEVRNFITWFQGLPIKRKIFIAGNHDTSIEAGYITRDNFGYDIHYLENEAIEIDGIKIFGSPVTPTFGLGWAYNCKRSKLHELWQTIPENIDIIAVHGPPHGILDLTYNRENNLELCGCVALAKRVKILNPKLCLFGHIHNMEDIKNQGIIKLSDHDTIYSNGSVVLDGGFNKGIISNGNILEI